MALLKYLKASKDGLPDPKGSLSSAIPTQKLIRKLSNFYHIMVQMEGNEDLIKGTSILVNLFNKYVH